MWVCTRHPSIELAFLSHRWGNDPREPASVPYLSVSGRGSPSQDAPALGGKLVNFEHLQACPHHRENALSQAAEGKDFP
jgi:hypothetical protein